MKNSESIFIFIRRMKSTAKSKNKANKHNIGLQTNSNEEL